MESKKSQGRNKRRNSSTEDKVYRKKINDHLDELRQLIPQCRVTQSTNKLKVLRNATEFIHAKERLIETLREHIVAINRDTSKSLKALNKDEKPHEIAEEALFNIYCLLFQVDKDNGDLPIDNKLYEIYRPEVEKIKQQQIQIEANKSIINLYLNQLGFFPSSVPMLKQKNVKIPAAAAYTNTLFVTDVNQTNDEESSMMMSDGSVQTNLNNQLTNVNNQTNLYNLETNLYNSESKVSHNTFYNNPSSSYYHKPLQKSNSILNSNLLNEPIDNQILSTGFSSSGFNISMLNMNSKSAKNSPRHSTVFREGGTDTTSLFAMPKASSTMFNFNEDLNLPSEFINEDAWFVAE
jgi:hypothetical protein